MEENNIENNNMDNAPQEDSSLSLDDLDKALAESDNEEQKEEVQSEIEEIKESVEDIAEISEQIENGDLNDDSDKSDIADETIQEAIQVEENETFENSEDFQPQIQEETATFETEFTPNDGMVTVRPVKFQEFQVISPNRTPRKNLDILQDISIHVTVELGRTKTSIKDVMEMEKGSIVELEKIAGEQVEIYANGKLVGKGEVIVIEDKFGVRVTSTNVGKPKN